MCLLSSDDTVGISLPHTANWSICPTEQATKTTASSALAGRYLMLAFLQEAVLMGITMLNDSLLVKGLHALSSLTRTHRLHLKLAAAVGG